MDRLFVWVWLPGASEPVVAGMIERVGDVFDFAYGQSYLARHDAIALYEPELPLRPGRQPPPGGLAIAGCLADAGPDGWGQRVILHKLLGVAAHDPLIGLDLLTYLAQSGSDRIGALDFQADPGTYVARASEARLDELLQAAERLEAGIPFTPALDEALVHGSSIGGARPKALLDDAGRKLIAKFGSSSDPYPVVKAEAVAMELARRVGLDVATTDVIECLGRDVLLVERFDRPGHGRRRAIVSALTLLGLDAASSGRYASYVDLADAIRARFTEPTTTLRELFGRIVLNILVGNTDDHAKNHAAFWDGSALTLTPAYDICPSLRSGGFTMQAMGIGRDGARESRLAVCLDAANEYLLDTSEAHAIITAQLDVIHAEWSDAADRARLTAAERHALLGRQIVNPFCLEGWT